MCFSCGFLVSVLWMVFGLPFVSLLVPFFAQFRFSPCPSFLSSTRFARFALLPVFRSALSFRLFVLAYRRGGSCGGVWGGAVGLSSGVARWRGFCRVHRFCQLGFPHSLRSSPFVSSFLVAAAALFVFVSSCVSDGVAAERCVVAEMRAVWLGGAMGGSVMPCRVAERAVSGTRDGTYGGTRDAPFLSARFGRSRVAIDRRGVLGEFSAFSTVE